MPRPRWSGSGRRCSRGGTTPGPKSGTPEEALEWSGETGTRSILDITRIKDQPDFGSAAPLTPAELERYFGTATPTVGMVEECDQLWEDLERGKARHIVTYEGDARRRLMFVGYSFD